MTVPGGACLAVDGRFDGGQNLPSASEGSEDKAGESSSTGVIALESFEGCVESGSDATGSSFVGSVGRGRAKSHGRGTYLNNQFCIYANTDLQPTRATGMILFEMRQIEI